MKAARGCLVLASYGFSPGQMTLETLVALRSCDRILCPAADEGMRSSLSELGLPAVQCCGAGQELLDLALSGLRAGGRVGVLTYGEPLFRNQDSTRLIRVCRRAGAACEIYHAVSSLNVLLARLRLGRLDPFGLFLGTLDSHRQIDPRVPALIFSPGQNTRKCLEKFVAAVRLKYPARHPVELVRIVFEPSLALLRKVYAAKDVARAIAEAGDAATLYLPAVRAPGPRR